MGPAGRRGAAVNIFTAEIAEGAEMMVNEPYPMSSAVSACSAVKRGAVNLFTAEIAEGAAMMLNEHTQSRSAVSARSAVNERP